MIDPLTQQLFGQYPREMAVPSRQIVHNQQDVETFLVYNEGIRDCYTSLYPLTGEITCVLFELDGYARALEDAKKIYKYLVDRGEIVVAVASGRKGIHLYLLLKHKKYGNEQETKKKLYYATYSILISVFGEEGYTKTTVDTSTIGDVRQIIRFPNTRRPPNNKSWCTYLTTGFLDAEWLDIINLTKMPYHMPRMPNPTSTLDDFPPPTIKIEGPQLEPPKALTPANGNWFLEGILRPCLFQGISQPNPLHPVRVATTVDLLVTCTAYEILEIYSKLGWVDFDSSKTMGFINQIIEKGYSRYECPTLGKKGVCLVSEISNCPLGAVPKVLGS